MKRVAHVLLAILCNPRGMIMTKKQKRWIEELREGRTDRVFDLIADGVSVDRPGEDGPSLMVWCAYCGDVSAIRYLIDRGASLSALGKNFDLNGAAFHGHWRLCSFLIEHGADPNHPLDDTGEVPLHATLGTANRPAHDLVVEVLLNAGADPNVHTRAGVETGCFMRDSRTRGETPLHRAAAFSSAETIQRLLDAGARVDSRDANGDSPLTWASWHLRPSSVLRLLCFDGHRIHPQHDSTYDHGSGWSQMDKSLLGRPVLNRTEET